MGEQCSKKTFVGLWSAHADREFLIVSYLPPYVIVVIEMCVFVYVRLLIQTVIF